MSANPNYPPGSWGAEVERLTAAIGALPLPLRVWLKWRIAKARRSMRRGQMAAIRRYLDG